jgi:endonuclease YncB( thermonuclease family)
MAGTPRRRSWFAQHKVLTGVLVLVVIGWVQGVRDDPAEVSDAAPPAEVPVAPSDSADEAETVRDDDPAESEPVDDQSAPTKTKTPKTRPAQATSPKRPKPRPRTFLVSRVVDGDTLELGNGQSVRLVGIDTPERGECGYDTATGNLERIVQGRRVRLGMSDEDHDRYGRLLRYVNVGKIDAGLRQIKSGWAIARYDSRDGYGYHPRENAYIATDKATPNKRCAKPKPQPLVAAPAGGACAPGYDPCVPAYPPDVNCPDVDGPIRVTGSDPHGLDADRDGIACE